MKLKEKFWLKIYYKAREENSREDSERVANESVKDFEKRFEKGVSDTDAFTQAGRLKRLFEEMELDIFCSNDEENSSILICGTDIKFHFIDGEFNFSEK